MTSQKALWLWDESGVWRPIGDREVKKRIHEISGSDELTKNIVDSILDLTKTEIYRPDHRFDQNVRAINVQNGELHWTGDLWKLRPHCREHYRTTQLPIAYDENARAQRFESFLEEIFAPDQDRVEKMILVCEAIGYSLLSSCEYEKFFLLIGPGANGKSVLMEIVAAMVGPNHVSAVQPSQFDNRFQRAHLHENWLTSSQRS